MYDPTVGRWLVEDPIEFRGGDANLYRYVGNDAENFTDPSGLDQQPEVKPGVLIKSGKIADLDAEYNNTPFKDTASADLQAIKDNFADLFSCRGIELPPAITEAGVLKLTSRAVKDKLEPGSYTAAFNVYFVRFDVCDPQGVLAIRLRELQDTQINDYPPKKTDWAVVNPKEANWKVGEKSKPDGRFDKSLVYSDSPGIVVPTKRIGKGVLGNEQEIVPYSKKLTIVQFVEVVNTKTEEVVAHKLVVMKVNLDETGKVNSGFLSETDPAYKALDGAYKE